MKADKKSWLALVILIGLVIWLIFISLGNRSADSEQNKKINQLTEQNQLLDGKISNIKPIDGKNGKAPVKGVDYKDGDKGPKGDTGTTGKKGDKGTKGDAGKTGAIGPQGAPARELLLDCVNSTIMKKYYGDDFWQPTNIKCETTNE